MCPHTYPRLGILVGKDSEGLEPLMPLQQRQKGTDSLWLELK